MDSDSVRLIIVMAVLVVLSAFFSSAETAFSSLNQVKLKSMLGEEGKKTKRIKRALSLSEEYDVVLSTILIGNNLVNIACTAISTIVFTGIYGESLGTTLSTVIMTIVVLIFGEVTPKQIAKERAEGYAILISPLVKFFTTSFTKKFCTFLSFINISKNIGVQE